MLSEVARARTRKVLNSLASVLTASGVAPNALTVAGFLFFLVVAVVIALGYEAIGGFLLIFAGALDAVDGTLARVTGKATKFGALLDSTLDRWADGALFIAIIFRSVEQQDAVTAYLAALSLLGSFLVSYTRARAHSLGSDVKEGWFSRFERMLLLIVGLILTAFLGPLALTTALALLAFFSNLTALQRLLTARRLLRD